MQNQSNSPFQINPGDLLAQIDFHLLTNPHLIINSSIHSNGHDTTPSTPSSTSTQPTACRSARPRPTLRSQLAEFASSSSDPALVSHSPYKNAVTLLSAQPTPSIFTPTKLRLHQSTVTNGTSPISSTPTSNTSAPVTPPPLNSTATDLHPPTDSSSSTSTFFPPIHPVERASSTSRKLVHLSSNHLYQYFGFRNIDTLLKHLLDITDDTVKLRKTSDDTIDSTGEFATIHKYKANKTLSPKHEKFSDTMHMDISYGSSVALNRIRSCLFIVDHATRKKYAYPLCNLEGDTILTQFKQFHTDIGITPKRMIADCDKNLLKGKMGDYFRDNHIIVTGAPKGRQNQNGLVERNWYTCVRMARAWISSSNLPPKFWFYAIKRAAEISNYFPILHHNKITTPFTLAHGSKPDFCTLFPMFSIAYVRETNDTTSSNCENFIHQSVKCIAIGRDNTSDGLLFYNPRTNRTILSADYRLDISKPAGTSFGYNTDDSLQFHLHDTNAEDFRPPEYSLGDIIIVTVKEGNIHNAHAYILSITLSDEQPYTVQLMNINKILHVDPSNIAVLPSSNDNNTIADAPAWLKHHAKCTLYIPSTMPAPKQGLLKCSDTNEWSFSPGRTPSSKQTPIPLPNFTNGYARQLTTSKQLIPGFQRKQFIQQQQQLHSTTNILALHVSATSLHSHLAPQSLRRHNALHPDDKIIWDKAYAEEYHGLQELSCFDYISETEYQSLKKVLGPLFQSIAISTIKHNEKGIPVRAKYRICALGNLDPHHWHKSDTFAPVLSQMELRLLIAEAAKRGVVPKTCDVKQSFIQSVLPDNEKYVLTPQPNCSITPPNTYLLLKKTLCGLKRSPRHWFDKCSSILQQLGLQPCPNAPCLFSGTIIPNHPPLYIGLYVDDCIYFSEDPAVEQAFQSKFSTVLKDKISFMGPVTHFLGIKFDCLCDNANNLNIYMSQTAFIDSLTETANLTNANAVTTPYHNGYPVDKIEPPPTPASPSAILQMQQLLGSLQWLSQCTRPDISTITNLLAQYQSNPSYQHIEAARRVIKYLKGTSILGIRFKKKKKHQQISLAFSTFLYLLPPLLPSQMLTGVHKIRLNLLISPPTYNTHYSKHAPSLVMSSCTPMALLCGPVSASALQLAAPLKLKYMQQMSVSNASKP